MQNFIFSQKCRGDEYEYPCLRAWYLGRNNLLTVWILWPKQSRLYNIYFQI